MTELPFNLHDLGIVPEVFCRLYAARITLVAHKDESGTVAGFWVRHPKNDCRHSEQKIVMPIVSLAEIVLKVK